MPESSPSDVAEPLSRDELIALVTSAHLGAPYVECKVAGAALAQASKLPRLIAENLGAGFGQWTFFPGPGEVVDFACDYVAPETAEDMWTLARAWASDDAASRRTILTLIGRELLKTELRRVEVPELRALMNEPRGASANALRKSLGLDAPAPRAPGDTKVRAPRPARSPRGAAKTPGVSAPSPEAAEATTEATEVTQPVKAGGEATTGDEATPTSSAVPTPAVKVPQAHVEMMRMPKPVLKRIKREEPPPPRHFEHPKFGVGVLERLDGNGETTKLTIKFASGTKTLLSRFVTEVATPDATAT